MKHIFIVNPAAGNGGAETEFLPSAIKKMKEAGLDYEFHRSLGKREIYEYVHSRATSGEPVRFYACGGDGTINDVMCGLVGCKNAELGVVPCGSGNDFVKNFSHIENFLDVEKQLNASTIDVDVIKYHDTYAINMFNIGMDCDIAETASKMKSDVIKGPMAYLAAVAKVMPKHKYYNLRYTINGETKEQKCMFFCIGNGCYCGGGFKSCTKAVLNDGIIDLCVVKPVAKVTDFAKLFGAYKKGTFLTNKTAMQFIDYYQVEKFSLEPLDECNVCIDGEIVPFSAEEFTIVRNAVKVALPKGTELINR